MQATAVGKFAVILAFGVQQVEINARVINIMEKFQEYDFLELVLFDVHCRSKGRLVSGKRMINSVLKNGIGIYGGACYHGIQEESTAHDYFTEKGNFGNQSLYPIPDTLTDAMPCAKGHHKVGQVLCTLKHADGSLEKTTPRVVAEKQLKAFADMGYSIRSSFELEFSLYHAATEKPFGHENKWASMSVIGDNEGILLDFMTELKACGVYTDTLQAEAGRGQYEMTLEVTDGLQSPDMAAKFKNLASIFFAKRSLKASFMTKKDIDGLSNGFHFNHSLWTPDGQSLFLDPESKDKFSAIGRHWLAGLIAHTSALTALCCPTVNCYRRLYQPYTPYAADWGKDRRSSCYRLKSEGEDNVYLEMRLPSSACNPYLVMAGVVAAGMDGIKRKLSLEEAKCDQELPRSLESALKALEEDEYMVEALGKEFVMMHAYIKRSYEIKPLSVFSNFSMDIRMQHEKEMYFNQI